MNLVTLKEAVEADSEDYYSAVDKYYQDPQLLGTLRMSDNMFRHVQTEKSDSGNFMVRWAEHGDDLFILGIVADTGRMKRGDVRDFYAWVDRLIDKIDSGMIVHAHPNSMSRPLVRKVVERAERAGVRLDVQHGRVVHRTDDEEWSELTIRKS